MIASPAAGTALALVGVDAGYGGRLAIEDVTGVFAAGSMTAIVGANGAGKTTLLNVLAGTTRPSAGRVVRDGPAPHAAGYIPQVAAIDRDYPVTVREFTAMGGWRGFGAFRSVPAALMPAVTAALRTVALEDAAATRIGALSVGQFRRVLFARLIMQQPRLVLLDEPFAAVDADTTALLLDLLLRWHAEGRTIVAALHDTGMVRTYFPETLALARRCLAWGPTAAALPAMAA